METVIRFAGEVKFFGDTFQDHADAVKALGTAISSLKVLIAGIRNPQLNRVHLKVLSSIAERLNNGTGTAWPDRKLIAAENGISVKSCQNRMYELRSIDLVTWEKRPNPNGKGKQLVQYTWKALSRPELQVEITKAIEANYPRGRAVVEEKYPTHRAVTIENYPADREANYPTGREQELAKKEELEEKKSSSNRENTDHRLVDHDKPTDIGGRSLVPVSGHGSLPSNSITPPHCIANENRLMRWYGIAANFGYQPNDPTPRKHYERCDTDPGFITTVEILLRSHPEALVEDAIDLTLADMAVMGFGTGRGPSSAQSMLFQRAEGKIRKRIIDTKVDVTAGKSRANGNGGPAQQRKSASAMLRDASASVFGQGKGK